MVGIGDLIENQALVVRIEPGRVVLRESGSARELTLAAASGLARRRDGEPFAVSNTDGEHAILNSLVGGVHVVPVFEEAQMVGLEFSLVQYGTHFEEIGLENGDVITEINGTPIDSPAGARSSWRSCPRRMRSTWSATGRTAPSGSGTTFGGMDEFVSTHSCDVEN